MVRQAPTWSSALDRVLPIGCATFLGLQAAHLVTALLSATEGRTRLLLGLILIGHLGLVVGCLVPSWRRPSAAFKAGLLLLAFADLCLGSAVTWVPDPGLSQNSLLMVPTVTLQSVHIVAICLSARLLPVVLVLLATAPPYLLLHRPLDLGGIALDQCVITAASTLVVCAGIGYLRYGSRYAEQLDRLNAANRLEIIAQRAGERARAAARRVIHDHVISALRAIEMGLPAASVRTACEEALSALDQQRPVDDLDDLLRSLRSHSETATDVVDRGWPATPPRAVLEALRDAAHEAMRNVARHSGSRNARVVASTGRDGELVLEITDEGSGAHRSAPTTFGIAQSIRARVEDVGGVVHITATPAVGTRVRLAWHPPASESPLDNPYAVANRRRGYLALIAPLIVLYSYLAARHHGDRPVATAMLLVSLSIALLLTAWRFGSRRPRPRDALWVCLTVSSATAIGLSVAPQGSLQDYRSWCVGMAAGLTMMLAFEVRPIAVVLPLVMQDLVILAFVRADPTVEVSGAVGAIGTTLSMVLVVGLFGVLLRRSSVLTRAAEQTRLNDLEESAWAGIREEARRIHLATLKNDVVPFLRSAATSPDTADRVEAAFLAARCRDELYLPQPLPGDVRRAVDEARRRGVVLNFRAEADDARPWPPGQAGIVGRFAASGRHDVITVFGGSDPRVVCLPPLSPGEQPWCEFASGSPTNNVTVESDGSRSVVRVAGQHHPPGIATAEQRDVVGRRPTAGR